MKLSDDDYWVVETKVREDLDVAMKDLAVQCWCENATELTGMNWSYLKVNQAEFEKLKPESFGELLVAICE